MLNVGKQQSPAGVECSQGAPPLVDGTSSDCDLNPPLSCFTFHNWLCCERHGKEGLLSAAIKHEDSCYVQGLGVALRGSKQFRSRCEYIDCTGMLLATQ